MVDLTPAGPTEFEVWQRARRLRREREANKLRLQKLQDRNIAAMTVANLSKIKMVISPWEVDDLGNMTRTIYRADS